MYEVTTAGTSSVASDISRPLHNQLSSLPSSSSAAGGDNHHLYDQVSYMQPRPSVPEPNYAPTRTAKKISNVTSIFSKGRKDSHA